MSGDGPAPTLLWLRRDLRLADHPGWKVALAGGGPVIPVFILDEVVEDTYGTAPLWRLGLSLADLERRLDGLGSRLVLRKGSAQTVLEDLIGETGARRVVWSRLYDPQSIARDKAVKKALGEDGIEAKSVNGSLLFEPWTVETGQGGFYKVYSPFWRAVRGREVADALVQPDDLAPPRSWPASDSLNDWNLGRAMNRGAAVVEPHARVGEAAARERLDEFIEDKIARYKEERNFLAMDATSGLSENLAHGEISPRQIWHAGWRAMETGPSAQAEHFLKELVWREFAYHLLYHTPHIETKNWREEWEGFPWAGDSDTAERWRRGMTGVDAVDAAMRQLYVTGTMHNRARMVVASFLTKHLLTDWRIGEAWFRDCLIDWDPASNAMGWQWVAGSGPDAAPYFRVFNPETQAQKFDPDETYLKRWIAEGQDDPGAEALSYFDAVPRSWNLSPDDPYPEPVVGLKEGREAALAAYQQRRS